MGVCILTSSFVYQIQLHVLELIDSIYSSVNCELYLLGRNTLTTFSVESIMVNKALSEFCVQSFGVVDRILPIDFHLIGSDHMTNAGVNYF